MDLAVEAGTAVAVCYCAFYHRALPTVAQVYLDDAVTQQAADYGAVEAMQDRTVCPTRRSMSVAYGCLTKFLYGQRLEKRRGNERAQRQVCEHHICI
jgi:hypothetical protein